MEALRCYIGHGLMENRSGLIVETRLTKVSGHAERLAALEMIESWGERSRAITLGADKGYDARDFVMELRELNVRPHLAQNTRGRRSAIDRRTTRHPGYATSQRIRKRKIGRASCRERVCQYVSISVVAVSLKKKQSIRLEKKV